ncbi:putative isoflavone reductase family protein [Eutypa lata UCREL1]|uniref:Putative isoflavone reductase family protein n=1 Tax=Eutypa lata (strain UCR-EL1) TaxID=1287681 RepID=M7SQC3_EUTLA|nr:putative isoflavone reductase family protein [Eutypa lata UCREL1]
MKVAIVGATGETGSVIVKGLLESTTPKYEVTALTRASSLQKPGVLALASKGVNVVAVDLAGAEEDLAKVLVGIDVVISTIYGGSVMAEIPLINASKAAGVKRYLPCFFATVVPPKGKEDVLNHIKKVNLPYTVVDVGWWYQVTLPRLPSGRIDYAVMETSDIIAGDGNVPMAVTDLRDVGKYVARIISDPRTLNKMVFAYSEIFTYSQMYDLMEKLSGEKLHRKYATAEEIKAQIQAAEEPLPAPDSVEFVGLSQLQYWYSSGVRGDNSPEYARYLGYLLAKDLYPEFKGTTLEAYATEVMGGKGKRVYGNLVGLPTVNTVEKV